jgi:hypothetical protein
MGPATLAEIGPRPRKYKRAHSPSAKSCFGAHIGTDIVTVSNETRRLIRELESPMHAVWM